MDIVRSIGSYDSKILSDQNLTICDPVSRTQQQFREECDINTIVKNFGLTGEMPVNLRTPLPDNVSYGPLEYREMLDYVTKARQSFEDQPAELRARFQNNPALFLDFVDNPLNKEEGIKLGIFNKPPTDTLPVPA